MRCLNAAACSVGRWPARTMFCQFVSLTGILAPGTIRHPLSLSIDAGRGGPRPQNSGRPVPLNRITCRLRLRRNPLPEHLFRLAPNIRDRRGDGSRRFRSRPFRRDPRQHSAAPKIGCRIPCRSPARPELPSPERNRVSALRRSWRRKGSGLSGRCVDRKRPPPCKSRQ